MEPIKENWREENLQLSQKTMRADQPHHYHHHHHDHYHPDYPIIITIIIMVIIMIPNCCCVRKKKESKFSKVCWVCLDTRVCGPACQVNVVQCSKRVPAQYLLHCTIFFGGISPRKGRVVP